MTRMEVVGSPCAPAQLLADAAVTVRRFAFQWEYLTPVAFCDWEDWERAVAEAEEQVELRQRRVRRLICLLLLRLAYRTPERRPVEHDRPLEPPAPLITTLVMAPNAPSI